MGDVYNDAFTVLIWLGEASSDSDLGLRFIKELCHCLAAQGITHTTSQDVTLLQPQDLWVGIKEYLGITYHRHWQAFMRLLKRPWWGRAWIIQELASSTHAVFCCGTKSIEWPQLELVFYILFVCYINRTSDNILDSEDVERTHGLARLKYWVHNGDIPALCELYSLVCRQDCGDPRDKVYSVLALTDAKTKEDIHADYSRPIAWVYTMAAKVDIVSRADLVILSLVQPETNTLDIPSWVVDWRTQYTMFALQCEDGAFAASGPDLFTSSSFSENLQTLYVDGFCIGMVEDDNVPQAKGGFSRSEDGHAYSWDVDAMVKRLINTGGITTWDEEKAIQQPAQSRQAVQRSLYDVLIAGQLSVEGRWNQVTYASDIEGANEQPKRQASMLINAVIITRGRTVILSRNRFLGLAPTTTRVGDRIFILYGLAFPMILRPREDGAYTVIGVAYIHGIMHGEALSGVVNRTFHDERLALQ